MKQMKILKLKLIHKTLNIFSTSHIKIEYENKFKKSSSVNLLKYNFNMMNINSQIKH